MFDNNKDTFCLFDFIKILSSFPDKCLLYILSNWWQEQSKRLNCWVWLCFMAYQPLWVI